MSLVQKPRSRRSTKTLTMAYQVDATDCKILGMLQLDGRLTNAQLACNIGLSPASTLDRVRKLEKQGIIQGYRTRLNYAVLGLETVAMLQIKLQSLTKTNIAAFKKAIDAIPEVVACHQVIGHADFLVKIITSDLMAYQQTLVDSLGEIGIIERIETLLITDTLKDTGVAIKLRKP